MSSNLEFIFLGILCVLGAICGFIAKKKGYSFWHWFFAGLLTYDLFFVSMFIISFLPNVMSFDEEAQSKIYDTNKKYAWGIILGHISFKIFEISLAKILG